MKFCMYFDIHMIFLSNNSIDFWKNIRENVSNKFILYLLTLQNVMKKQTKKIIGPFKIIVKYPKANNLQFCLVYIKRLINET